MQSWESRGGFSNLFSRPLIGRKVGESRKGFPRIGILGLLLVESRFFTLVHSYSLDSTQKNALLSIMPLPLRLGNQQPASMLEEGEMLCHIFYIFANYFVLQQYLEK